nr:M23 family metallopeptidase [Miniimonas sp. S16]
MQLAGFDVDSESCTTQAGVISADGWTHPLPGFRRIWHNYGVWRGTYAHAGEDLAAPAGTPIYAAANGLVTRSSCTPFQGRSPCNIIIDHGTDPTTGKRLETWYVHMYPTGVHAQVGDHVSVGQHIADVGSNGNSTGPHLHLEVHLDGETVDPVTFFATRGVDLSRTPTAPTISAAAGQALTWARTQLGMPYALGATGPNSYDCSGLTLRAYEAAGITLPRTSREQYTATTRINRADLQPGDLIFWSNDATPAGIYHVAIYAGKDAAGADRIVQAPAPGTTVEEIGLWSTNLYGYGRVTH